MIGAGYSTNARLHQHLLANGIAVVQLNPYTADTWEWYTPDLPLHGGLSARSHCRFAPPRIQYIPDSLRYSVPLFMKRQCGRTPGGLDQPYFKKLFAAMADGSYCGQRPDAAAAEGPEAKLGPKRRKGENGAKLDVSKLIVSGYATPQHGPL